MLHHHKKKSTDIVGRERARDPPPAMLNFEEAQHPRQCTIDRRHTDALLLRLAQSRSLCVARALIAGLNLRFRYGYGSNQVQGIILGRIEETTRDSLKRVDRRS